MTAYIAIIFKVFKSQRRIKAHGESKINNSLNRESALARRVFAIILTDFCCWIPVIILGILALVEKFNDPEGTAYVWFAVFVLPVNSSVNPLLYTFSTPKVGTQMGNQLRVNVSKNRRLSQNRGHSSKFFVINEILRYIYCSLWGQQYGGKEFTKS